MHPSYVEPRFSGPLIDDVGFTVDVWAERETDDVETAKLEGPAALLSGVVLTRRPYLARGLVTVDDDGLWVSVEVMSEGEYDAEVTTFARQWFDDLWDAVHLGAHPDAAELHSAPQLLALARANRSMDWDSAVVWAGFTSPRPSLLDGLG